MTRTALGDLWAAHAASHGGLRADLVDSGEAAGLAPELALGILETLARLRTPALAIERLPDGRLALVADARSTARPDPGTVRAFLAAAREAHLEALAGALLDGSRSIEASAAAWGISRRHAYRLRQCQKRSDLALTGAA